MHSLHPWFAGVWLLSPPTPPPPHPTPDPCGLPCLHPAWFSLALMQTCPEEGEGGEGLWGGGAVLKGIFYLGVLYTVQAY
jgi:hypothetical protein